MVAVAGGDRSHTALTPALHRSKLLCLLRGREDARSYGVDDLAIDGGKWVEML